MGWTDYLPMIVPGASIAILTFLVNFVPQGIQNIKEKVGTSYSKINKNSGDTINKLYNNLSVIKGQEHQKAQLIDIVSGWLEAKCNPNSNRGGLVIHLAGISGTGKSMTANAISHAFLGKAADKIVKISYSSIDCSSSQTITEQIFGQTTQAAGQTKVVKNTALTAQLINNPKTVVVIEEFDKLMQKDPSLSAKLWDIADVGYFEVNGRRVDASQTVFILTSNASPESVGINKDSSHDTSNSLETIEFSQAFLNRINTIYFDDFTEQEYTDVLREHIQPIRAYYFDKFKIKFDISNQDMNKIAKYLKSQKVGGARNVRPVMDKLYTALASYKNTNKIQKNSKTVRTISLSYNEETLSFSVNK